MDKTSFTDEEKKLFMDLVLENRELLENPKTDSHTAALKLKKWAEIANTFNARFPERKRTVNQLTKSWDKIRRGLINRIPSESSTGASGEPIGKTKNTRTKIFDRSERAMLGIDKDEIKKMAKRRLILEAKKMKEHTQTELDMHALAMAEQKLRVAISNERLNQQKLQTKLLGLKLELQKQTSIYEH